MHAGMPFTCLVGDAWKVDRHVVPRCEEVGEQPDRRRTPRHRGVDRRGDVRLGDLEVRGSHPWGRTLGADVLAVELLLDRDTQTVVLDTRRRVP